MRPGDVPETPQWQWWRRIATHFGIPISPGARVDDARRSTIKRLSEVVIRHVSPYHSHLFMHRVCHCVGHKAHGIRKCFCRSFKPNYVRRNQRRLLVQRYRFHKAKPRSSPLPRIKSFKVGSWKGHIQPLVFAIHSSTSLSRSVSGTPPFSSTTAWKSLRSNFGPSAALALSRSSRILSWPTL
jgi:hypothetical protein